MVLAPLFYCSNALDLRDPGHRFLHLLRRVGVVLQLAGEVLVVGSEVEVAVAAGVEQDDAPLARLAGRAGPRGGPPRPPRGRPAPRRWRRGWRGRTPARAGCPPCGRIGAPRRRLRSGDRRGPPCDRRRRAWR